MKPFMLIVWAIVAVMLVLIVTSLFYSYLQPKSIAQELRESIEKAKSPIFIGKSVVLLDKSIANDTLFSRSIFDTVSDSVAFECNDPKDCCPKGELCDKPIEWTYTNIDFKSALQKNIYTRCYYEKSLAICRVYVGKAPAQATIVSSHELKRDASGVIVSLKVINSGEITMAFGEANIILEKEASGKWVDTKDTFVKQEIDSLLPKAEHTFVWVINPTNIGKYRILFHFESINSGFDENTLVIDINKNSFCVVDETQTNTIPSENTYREIHYCNGCNYAYECAGVWGENSTGVTYTPYTKDETYCTKQTETGSCQS